MAENSFLYVDFTPILEKYQEVGQELTRKLSEAAKGLAISADAHIRERAAQKLHTRLPFFLENLKWEEIGNGTFAVVINAAARWVEDGMEPHNMLEDLLSSPKAKTVKEGPNKGKKYVIVPFKQNKGKTQRTPQQQALFKELSKAMKAKNVSATSTGKIERNGDGTPKLGLLHSFDVALPNRQRRLRSNVEGPSRGPRMGNNQVRDQEHGPDGKPFLWGVRVYQHEKKDKKGNTVIDKEGNSVAERSVFTFRVAMQGSSQWNHPGLSSMHFLDEAHDWVRKQWDEEIAPSILQGLNLE